MRYAYYAKALEALRQSNACMSKDDRAGAAWFKNLAGFYVRLGDAYPA